MTADGTRGLNTVMGTISGDGMVLPLTIYRGWYQHLDSFV